MLLVQAINIIPKNNANFFSFSLPLKLFVSCINTIKMFCKKNRKKCFKYFIMVIHDYFHIFVLGVTGKILFNDEGDRKINFDALRYDPKRSKLLGLYTLLN